MKLLARLTLAFAVVLLAKNVRAQEPATSATPNYAVPDVPAFRILNADPSNIDRPSSFREFSAGISNFIKSGGALPAGFFAEFSPYAVLARTTLSDYQQEFFAKLLFRTRLSIATRVKDDGTSAVHSSVGLRLTLWDNADPRLNSALITAIQNQQSLLLQKIGTPPDPRVDAAGFAAWQAKNEALVSANAAIPKQISQLIEYYKDSSWNKDIAELGLALRYLNADSLVKSARIDAIAAWVSTAWGFGNSNQLLLSTSPTVTRGATGTMDSVMADLSARFYWGTNTLKVSLETGAQGTWGKASDGSSHSGGNWTALVGGEYNVTGNLWLDFNAGCAKDLTVASGYHLVSSFKVKFGTGK